MKLFNRIAYTVATFGPLGSWSELGPVIGGLGFLFMWYLPGISLVLGGVSPSALEFLVMGFVVLVLQKALLDDRVVWYGEIPVAPHIAIDWFLGALVAVHGVAHIRILYALAFLIYLVLNTLRPLGIAQARVLPKFWGIIADDLASGALTHIMIGLLSPLLLRFFGG